MATQNTRQRDEHLAIQLRSPDDYEILKDKTVSRMARCRLWGEACEAMERPTPMSRYGAGMVRPIVRTLATSNQGLIRQQIRKYSKMSDEGLADLYQAGYMGLETAAQKYDPSKGTKFSTYAYPWVQQYLSQCADKKVHFTTSAYTPVVSLDAPSAGSSTFTLMSTLESSKDGDTDEDIAEEKIAYSDMVEKILQFARHTERDIILARFGLLPGFQSPSHKNTYKEIGAHIGMPEESVRRIYNNAVERISRQASDLRELLY